MTPFFPRNPGRAHSGGMFVGCARRRGLFLLLALAATAGCGGQESQDARKAEALGKETRDLEVSPERMRAAQLLSLSGGIQEPRQTGYAGMVDCAASLDLFVQAVEDSPLIDEAQTDVLERALGLFRSRARGAGSVDGKTPQQVNSDIAKAKDDASEDAAASSRRAIACIRELASESQQPGGAG